MSDNDATLCNQLLTHHEIALYCVNKTVTELLTGRQWMECIKHALNLAVSEVGHQTLITDFYTATLSSQDNGLASEVGHQYPFVLS